MTNFEALLIFFWVFPGYTYTLFVIRIVFVHFFSYPGTKDEKTKNVKLQDFQRTLCSKMGCTCFLNKMNFDLAKS